MRVQILRRAKDESVNVFAEWAFDENVSEKTKYVPMNQELPVITPLCCKGYRMPFEGKAVEAEFQPAINQIWIKGFLTNGESSLIHAHEAMHFYTTCLQPSQLLLLRAELLGYVDRPSTDCLVDIVETVCEACFWTQTNLGLDDIPYIIQDAEHSDVLRDLFEVSKNIIIANSFQVTEKGLKEVVAGICMLMMNIIPKHPNEGLRILNIIKKLPLPRSIGNRWSIYYDLHEKLYYQWERTKNYRDLFTLMLAMDSHRYVADMINFINAALRTVHLRPRTITAVFPVLLSLLTQASFVLLPFLYIKPKETWYEAEIKIIHSTSNSEDELRKTVLLQEEAIKKNEKKGIDCGTAQVFLRLINEAQKYRISTRENRTKDCFSELLTLLPNLLGTHIKPKNNCPGCSTVFQGDLFTCALDNIINMSNADAHMLIDKIEHYSQFLQTDTMRIIQRCFKLPSIPKAICRYEYL